MVVALLAGCGPPQPAATAEPAPGRTVALTDAPPVLAVTTGINSAFEAATAVAESGDTTRDMVVLGDSLMAEGYGVLPEAHAALIEEDLGVGVEVQNLATGARQCGLCSRTSANTPGTGSRSRGLRLLSYL